MKLSLVAGVTLAWSGLAWGQPADAFVNQQRLIEHEIRMQLDKELTIEQRALLDYGGSYNFFLFMNDDGVNSSRTLRRNDLRLWARTSVDEGTHEGYVRARTSYLDFNHGDGFYGDEDSAEKPRLERGFYQFSLRKAMKAYGHQQVSYDLRAAVGRQYIELGTGYAISLPMDAVTVTGELAGFQVMGLFANSVRSLADIDQSRLGWGDMDRNFYAVEVRYLNLRQHQPFFYAAWNDDRNGWNILDWQQGHEYNSRYFGFGSTGALVGNNLYYSTEWVFEKGTSFGDQRFLYRDHIDAWAWDVEVDYMMPAPMKPRLSAEYMFASGDPDRLGSPMNARGGNRVDHEDSSFVGFGFRDTGMTLAPRLSNIHIWRFGASFFPLEKMEFFKDLQLGTDWFIYCKHHSVAAISDPLADQPDGFLGWEMDYFANWRLTSDLSWTIRYGLFFPGEAYSDESCRYFFLTGLTWSF
jgi:hypothetical protein